MLEEFSSLVWESHVIQQNFNISVERWFPAPYYLLADTMYINMYFSKVLGIYMLFFTYKIFKFMYVIEETCENLALINIFSLIYRFQSFTVVQRDGQWNLWSFDITLISRGLDKVSFTESILSAFDFPINVSSLLKHTRFFLL